MLKLCFFFKDTDDVQLSYLRNVEIKMCTSNLQIKISITFSKRYITYILIDLYKENLRIWV